MQTRLKATPTETRKALEMVEALKNSGIRFVPIPVFSDEEHDQEVERMQNKIDWLVKVVNELC